MRDTQKDTMLRAVRKGGTSVAKGEEGEIPDPLGDGVSGQDQEAGLKEWQEENGDLEGRKG